MRAAAIHDILPLRLRALVVILALIAAAGCRPRAGASEDIYQVPPLPTTTRAPLLGYEAHFEIAWNGARVGDASEYLRLRQGHGMRFERRERITVRRGEALAHSETDIGIELDADFQAQRVTVHSIASGMMRTGVAQRNRHGDWSVEFADEPERRVPGRAVPAEIVPLLLARAAHSDPGADRDRVGEVRFEGPVLLAGYGFAVADLRVEQEAPGRLVALLSTPEGTLRSRFFLAQGGTISRIQGEGGVGARRVTAAALAAPFTPPEIVDAASVPVAGATIAEPDPALLFDSLSERAREGRDADASAAVALTLVGVPDERALPPSLPGQSVRQVGDRWLVTLSRGDTCAPTADSTPSEPLEPARDHSRPHAGAPADMSALAEQLTAEPNARWSRREEVYALARATADLLDDDLGSPGGGVAAALTLGRGDCTAHALLFAALARARGVATRLVTGYRLVENRLIRHRWALAAVDGRWLAVDPTYGEAPTSARLFGLATHGTRAAELALADEIAFAGLGALQAHAPAPVASGPRCDPTRPRTP